MQADLVGRGVMREDSGIYIIRQSMPYPLGETNVFLIESGHGWSVIDVGVDLPGTRLVWEQAVRELGISFKQIEGIYITHCHPDHLGAARWLQQCSDAPVYMLQADIDRGRKYIFLDEQHYKEQYWQAVSREMTAHQFPEHKTEELLEDWYSDVRPLYLEPAELLPLYAGDKIELAGHSFEVIPAPGHTDGQFLLWSAQRKHMFLGDLLAVGAYLHFTDWPNTVLENPLENLFAIIAQLKTMDVVRAFPGHGPVIEDLPVRLDKLLHKHQRVLNQIEAAVKSPVSAGMLYPQLFPAHDYVHHHRVALGEALGYLTYLASQGRLAKVIRDDGVVLFQPLAK